jgi:hypothetical protein
MTKASDNLFPKVIIVEGSAPSSPSAGDQTLFIDSSDHKLKRKNSSGTVTSIETAAGSGTLVEIDYVAFTSVVSPTATTEATANSVVASNSVAYDGSTVVLIEFFCAGATPETSGTTSTLIFTLYDGSSSIGIWGYVYSQAASNAYRPIHLARRLTPSNASHTYSCRAYVSGGTGTVIGGAGGAAANVPGFIRITKVTP